MAQNDPKMRVASDKYYEFTERYGGMTGDNVIPVDMYGHRVWPTKDVANQQQAADDIKEYYGLKGDCGFSPNDK